jgi:hypothetical protein
MTEKKKLQYDVVLFGKELKKMNRRKARAAKKGILESPLGKMRSRQERKSMAKSLKVPFTPRYNGEVIKKQWQLVTAKNKKYTKLVLVAK